MSSKQSRRSSAQLLRRLASRNTDSADTAETAETAPPPAYDASARDLQVQDPPPPNAIGQAQGPPGDAARADLETANLTAAFENLNLTNLPADPTVETCLAHLKILFAIQWMKEDVGFTDGLWGLWDARAGPVDPILKGRPEKEKATETEKVAPEPSAAEKLRSKNLLTLSKIREKRWALFVARAVDRYETWWKSLMRVLPTRPLTESDMAIAGFELYAEFPVRIDSVPSVTEDMLPPLDVLMVWHTHMLNPRAYLEDAMLAGLRQFWATGMPWDLVAKAIDNDFNYNVSPQCKDRWTHQTGLAWDNADDPLVKRLKCPRCSALIEIPWTTCGLPEDYKEDGLTNLTGNGYGDSNLRHSCRCGAEICKEYLSVAKFVDDAKALIGPARRPMPGTLLLPKTGTPVQPVPVYGRLEHITFPNRLLQSGCNSIRSTITGLTTHYARLYPTMNDVRKEIEEVLKDKAHVRQIDQVPSYRSRYLLPADSRVAIRKMMSRYWENFSLFALDLGGAVMRQGTFAEKMCKLDWLHSPSARETMARLLTKYGRFMDIMKANPSQVAVPTLDVDLAWHTHQLSPSAYYRYTVNKMQRFVDHDDKIDDNTLSRQFEWTSKVYQDWYGEVYSECTCWYCEAIRTSHISTVGKVLGLSRQEKVAESFHTSGAASLHPPSTSAHISSHNAVLSHRDPLLPASHPLSTRETVTARLAAMHKRRLDAAHAKARARAEKKGREPPRRDDVYYDHWGYPYLYSAPYMYALWWTPGLYYGWYPGYVYACGGGGGSGGCAAGTCGGGVAAGACGGAGGCGGDGAGGSGAGCGGGDGGGGGGCGGGCGGGGCGG